MKEYDSTPRPRVSENWLLRNDRKYIVAYKSSLEKYVFHVLSPEEASIISLFDGTNTLGQIKDAFFKIFDLPPNTHPNCSKYFEKLTSGLFSIDGFLSFSGKPSPSVSRNKDHLIPVFSNYHYPVKRLVRPISVILGFTNRCFCDCIYCYAERGKCQEYPLEKWRDIFQELSENNITLVDIGGGEIFARQDVLEILGEMASREFTFFVSTKSYISREYAEQMYGMGIGRYDIPERIIRPVQVSIDSAVPEDASLMVRYPGYLEIAAKSVSNLVQAGISPRVKCILTALNADAAEGIVRHFSTLGVTEFHFSQYQRSLYCHDDALFLTSDQKSNLEDTIEHLKSSFPDLKINFMGKSYVGGPRNVTREAWQNRCLCSGGRIKMVIKPDGDVTLCEQTPHSDEFVVGNIFAEGIMGVWNSKKLQEFIHPAHDKFKGTVCFDCPEFYDCHDSRGYCFRDSYCSYGTIYDAPPECPRQDKMPNRNI